MLFCAVSADLLPLPEYDSMDLMNQASPPGSTASDHSSVELPSGNEPGVYPLGTDTMGRDILTRLIFGARVSLLVGLITPLIGLVVGGTLGIVAGFYRGWLDTCIMATMNVILAFPGLVLLLAITFYLGQSLINIIIALGILTIPSFSRIAREIYGLTPLEKVSIVTIPNKTSGPIIVKGIPRQLRFWKTRASDAWPGAGLVA